MNKLEKNGIFDIITGDESWVFQYDPEAEGQIFQWTNSQSPPPKTARTSCSKVKTQLIVFAASHVKCATDKFQRYKWQTNASTKIFRGV